MDIRQEIIEEYYRHNSLFKTAKKLDVSVAFVKDTVENLPKPPPQPDRKKLRWEGFGDPDKERHLVSRMPAVEVWDNELPEIVEARRKHEAGTHTLATGRDGPWILLYCFPQIVKTPRPHYFSLEREE